MKSTGQATKVNGFSLIEVLVSLSIFTVIVTISISTLYTLIEASSRTRNVQSIATNLSFTLDSMTREIRTGSDYYCAESNNDTLPSGADDKSTRDCTDGGEAFAFNEGGQSLTGGMDSNRIAYRLSDYKLQRRLSNNDWADLTSDDVKIDTLEFYVEGSTRGDENAPIVTIFLSGEVGDEFSEKSEFSIQTTVAQRLLDF